MSRRAHILSILGHTGFGGDESRLLALAQALDYSRHRLTVLVLEPRGSTASSHGDLFAALVQTPAEVRFLDDVAPFRRRFARSRSLRALHQVASRILRVGRLIDEWQVDLVDARLQAGVMAGVLAARATHRPSIATLYNVRTNSPYPGWWAAQQIVLPLASALVTDSDARLREFKDGLLKSPRHLRVIPNGVTPPAIESPRAKVMEHFGLPEGFRGRLICQIGGLVPYKGHVTLLSAGARVMEEEPDVVLLLVGYPRDASVYAEDLRREADRLGISDRVFIGGYPGAIGDVWQLVDIHVHASYVDSLPNVILEGMSLAKPCVATRVGGIPEAVLDSDTGLLVEPRDANELAKALLRLLRDRSLARSLGQAAYSRYMALYRREHLAANLESLIEELLDPR